MWVGKPFFQKLTLLLVLTLLSWGMGLGGGGRILHGVDMLSPKAALVLYYLESKLILNDKHHIPPLPNFPPFLTKNC